MDPTGNKTSNRLKVLVLYDDWTAQTAAVHEQLLAFRVYSKHDISYAIGTGKGASSEDAVAAGALADGFDVIVVHHSVRLIVDHYINPAWAAALETFVGYKVLFTQDDYERTETTRQWIERIGFNALFTVVPEESWDKVYPRSRFPNLERRQVLTGYVPTWAVERTQVKPLAERTRFIGYRAFELPWYLGDLAREKFIIGKRMRELCEARGISVDIEWTVDKRIYGDAWYDFTEDCRATLGTESGSNVFDDDGEIERAIAGTVASEPEITYEEIHSRILSQHEGRVVMNQVSPRIFEAIALGSALVLFEGGYSGVVRPHEHFIPLKKDFSNVEEVIEKIQDIPALQEMTRRARRDVVESGLYSYAAFMARFDAFLNGHATPRPVTTSKFWISAGSEARKITHSARQLWLGSEHFKSSEQCAAFFQNCGSRLPDSEIDALEEKIAKLSKKNADLRVLRQNLILRERAAASAVAVLTAFLTSRTLATVRALGLSGSPPAFKASRAQDYVQELRAYIEGDRWLRNFARRDARVQRALREGAGETGSVEV